MTGHPFERIDPQQKRSLGAFQHDDDAQSAQLLERGLPRKPLFVCLGEGPVELVEQAAAVGTAGHVADPLVAHPPSMKLPGLSTITHEQVRERLSPLSQRWPLAVPPGRRSERLRLSGRRSAG